MTCLYSSFENEALSLDICAMSYALCPLLFIDRADSFMDDTISSYLSLIHNSRPDTLTPGCFYKQECKVLS